ncbi:hypothetical protein WISP_131178 [Willisornis vidua]|uniref:Uncharacterized protein n=1 Tax=Willisornis vidua TaxID=1566151 RepID=A0ABQ9CW28_9PASS|nr:hypothetical protein WISP_131178 [Willisornis vidua]
MPGAEQEQEGARIKMNSESSALTMSSPAVINQCARGGMEQEEVCTVFTDVDRWKDQEIKITLVVKDQTENGRNNSNRTIFPCFLPPRAGISEGVKMRIWADAVIATCISLSIVKAKAGTHPISSVCPVQNDFALQHEDVVPPGKLGAVIDTALQKIWIEKYQD